MSRIGMAIILATCAMVFLLRPMWVWKWHTFMWVKGGEPTETAKLMIFVEGVMMAVFAIILACSPADWK
jgi:hypothetical protein